jgi:NAD+ kinase
MNVGHRDPTERTLEVATIGLVAARSKDEAQDLAREAASWLQARGCTVIPEPLLEVDGGASADAIVVLGGDGLMMRAANHFPDRPLLGINFGKVGFLALIEQKDWRAALTELVEGRFAVQDGSTLAATLTRHGRTTDQGWAINDVVIRSGVRMVDVELYIDGHYVNTYPGDGMIVATPHGSTAYGMAAGGPILTAGVRGVAIVPISCHSPIRTPLVTAEGAVIELVVADDDEAQLIVDGRPLEVLQQGDLVTVRRGSHRFRLVDLGSTSFYEAVRTKFNFQIRPDAVPTRRPSRRPW